MNKEKTIKSSLFNGFSLQAFISSTPSIVTVAIIPFIVKHLGLAYIWIGVIFFLLRVGLISGRFIGPFFLKWLKPHYLCAIFELKNFFLITIIWFYFDRIPSSLFAILWLLKGIIIGAISTLVFSWLRHLSDVSKTKRTLITVMAIIQSSYGVAGVIILTTTPDINLIKNILLIDALSSCVGLVTFLNLRRFRAKDTGRGNAFSIFKFPFLNRERVILLIVDILVAAGLGGANILLVKYGEMYFSTIGGYGTTLVVYAIAFLIVGFLFNIEQSDTDLIIRRLTMLCVPLMWAGLVVLAIASDKSLLGIAGFSLVYLNLPIFFLRIQAKWFTLSTPEEAAKIFAYRSLLVDVVSAVGEVVYGSIKEDILIRITLLTLAIILGIAFRNMIFPHTQQS